MRDLIIRTLEAMDNIEEKTILKGVLGDIFLEIYNESEKNTPSLSKG